MRRSIQLAAISLTALVGIVMATPAIGTPRQAAQTPQNGRILFDGWGCVGMTCTSSTNPAYDLWSVEPDGSGLTNLTPTPGVDADAAWAPDGETILFNSDREGTYDLFLMDPNGSNVRRLTAGPGGETYADWSPDGRHIAYVSTAHRRDRIAIMNADGSRKRIIASFPPGLWVYALEWSPTGRWIAFSKGEATLGPQEPHRTFLIRPDGSGLRRLAPRVMWAVFPSWSPDGERLVFSGAPCDDGDPCNSRLWMIRRDGGGLRRVFRGNTDYEYGPDWSPDGTQIAYTTGGGDPVTGGGDPIWGGDIWVVNVDGTNNHQLVAKPDTFDWRPEWQPLP